VSAKYLFAESVTHLLNLNLQGFGCPYTDFS
jgi:hypothetical protein